MHLVRVGKRRPRSGSIIRHTKRIQVSKRLDIFSAQLDDSNTEPYGVSSPFSLPPYESLAPTPLPENTPPFCVYPPFTSQPPPSTAIPFPPPTGGSGGGGGSYNPSLPPPSSSTPTLPNLSPPPSSAGGVPSPPQGIPSPIPIPNPPPLIVPSPPTYNVPSPPSGSEVPSPPTFGPSPTQPVLSPPYYFEPSPPSTFVPSPPLKRPIRPIHICPESTCVPATSSVSPTRGATTSKDNPEFSFVVRF